MTDRQQMLAIYLELELERKGRMIELPYNCVRAIYEYLSEKPEQKHGRWERLTGMAPPEYHGHKICSVCGCLAPYNPIHPGREELSRYCPGCGARMDGGRDEQ